jgi:hypothetical protein
MRFHFCPNMIKRILFLSCIILITSCENKESEDFLTNGTWMLDTGANSNSKESVTFNSDGTYIIESRLTMPRRIASITGKISGDWTRQIDLVTFLSSIIDLPDNPDSLTVIPTVNGSPAGAFFGYLVDGIYQKDSSLIDPSGTIRFDKINESEIFLNVSTQKRFWLIKSITSDSLKIECNGKLINYYK